MSGFIQQQALVPPKDESEQVKWLQWLAELDRPAMVLAITARIDALQAKATLEQYDQRKHEWNGESAMECARMNIDPTKS